MIHIEYNIVMAAAYKKKDSYEKTGEPGENEQ